jgi:hypothetical protein
MIQILNECLSRTRIRNRHGRLLVCSLALLALSGLAPMTSSAKTVNLVDLVNGDGSQGFSVSGWAVAPAGDVNADGIPDVLIGAPVDNPPEPDIRVYVVFGRTRGFGPKIDIAQLTALDGTNGFKIKNAAPFDASYMDSVGDVNGDGVDDCIISHRFLGPSYVIFGSRQGFPAVMDVTQLDGNNGFRITRGTETLGFPVHGVGDLNGDGVADIALQSAVAPAEGNLYVRRGYILFGQRGWNASTVDTDSLQGQTGFQVQAASVSCDIGSDGLRLNWAGDVNGDGRDDLIVGSPCASARTHFDLAGQAYVLFGRTTGTPAGPVTFAPAVGIPVAPPSTGVEFVAAGDFNRDDHLDLVVVLDRGNNDLGMVAILPGNGDGTFQSAGDFFLVGVRPSAVTVEDFNHDGAADLVVSNRGKPTAPTNSSLSVLLGNGDNTFQAAVDYDAGIFPARVAVGDFNGDGNPDLAVGNISGRVSSDNVGILLGNADGTFQAVVQYPVGYGPGSVAVGDFDQDGKLDLAVPNMSGNDLSLLRGNGDGTFLGATNYPVGSTPREAIAADLNQDGRLDLVVANYLGGTVGVLLGNGDGTFQTVVTYPAGGNLPASLAVQDFNSDGKADLAVAIQGDSKLGVLLGNGDGSFQSAITFPVVGVSPLSVAVGDSNGDSKPDVATNSSPNISLLLNTTAGFPAVVRLPESLSGTSGFTINGSSNGRLGVSVSGAGDVNADGVDDVIVSGEFNSESFVFYGEPGWSLPVVDIFGLNGENGFSLQGSAGNFRVSDAGDVNGDGIDDVVVGQAYPESSGGRAYVIFGSSSGIPAFVDLANLPDARGFTINGLPPSPMFPSQIDLVSTIGDVNNDTIDDVTVNAAGFASRDGFVIYGAGTPGELLEGLVRRVVGLGLPAGIERSLLAKIDQAGIPQGSVALARSKAGQPTKQNAVNVLRAFINEVRAQRGKKIMLADADWLIARAEKIIAVLTV